MLSVRYGLLQKFRKACYKHQKIGVDPLTSIDKQIQSWQHYQSCLKRVKSCRCRDFCANFFFSIWIFFQEHSRITGLQGKGEGISFTPHYHFQPPHRRLDISQAITAESSPLHIASSRARTGNLWSPSASR